MKLCIAANGITTRFEVTDGLAMKVYVKGGSGGNLYDYSGLSGVDSDCGLVTPVFPQNQPAVSHVSFCLVYVPTPGCEETVDETGWSAGDRYVLRGNWATYTAYEADKTVTLWAGKNHDAGSVTFAPLDGQVKITIQLSPGYSFAEKPENVKVQDYQTAPIGNPSPGQFEHKTYATGSTATIWVPENNFYGVHVDLLRCK